jgi:MinD-like ATPase involved in chromosome partitioning or flagellar assembly
VVGNHRDGAGELDRRGAETFLGAHISVEIPFASTLIATSVNKAMPFVITSPAAPASVAMQSIAAAVDPVSRNGGDEVQKADPADKKKRTRRLLGRSR